METGNIIAVYNDDKRIALNEFDALMRKTNDYMNKIATLSDRFRGCDAKQLEKETLAAIREQCTNTSFNPSDIELVSGQRFPDIVAGQHFGVEVKAPRRINGFPREVASWSQPEWMMWVPSTCFLVNWAVFPPSSDANPIKIACTT